MSTITEDERIRFRARSEEIALAGRRWVTEKAAELKQIAFGTVVIFDIETGEYVTGATRIEAMDEFDLKIGAGRPGFIHQVGKRVFIGGGLLG